MTANVGFIIIVCLFLVMAVSAIYVFQAQGGVEVLNPEKLQGIAGLAGMFTSPGGAGIASGGFGTAGTGVNPESMGSQDLIKEQTNCTGKSYATINGKTSACVNGVMTETCTKEGEVYKESEFLKTKIVCENGKWVSKKLSEETENEGSSGTSEGSSGSSGNSGTEGSTTGVTYSYYCDNDKDGDYGSTKFTTQSVEIPLHCTKSVPVYPDCDDSNSNIHIGALEICDGIDNDCDKYIDEDDSVGCSYYYYDGDQDGYGNAAIAVCKCSKPNNYVTNSGDCQDTQDNTHPNQIETCNQKDDDCDGQIDEGSVCSSTTYYCDEDHDGYTTSVAHSCTGSNCIPSYCYSSPTSPLDCNDAVFAIHSGAMETCNGVDDNCDGIVDPYNSNNCKTYFYDGDKDGYGSPDGVCLCAPIGDYTATKTGDCNSNTAEANPGMMEKCDGIDNDCDGQIDEFQSVGCTVYYYDFDGDGWGISTSKCLCSAGGSSKSDMYYTAIAKPRTDCNDANPLVNPGISEAYPGKSQEGCANQIDDDCDGKIDMNDPDCQVPV